MHFWSLLAVGAGIASGLLYFGASFGTPLGLLLSNVALLPLFLAGLGIGAIGAGIAALAGAIVVGSQFGFYGGGTYFAFHGLPVLILQSKSHKPRSFFASHSSAVGGIGLSLE